MHAEAIIITVRYSSGTYVARARGSRHTASCTHDLVRAARQLARKLDLDVLGMKRGPDLDGVATFEAWPLKTGPIAEIYGELWRKASSMGYESVTEALAELERIKAQPLRRLPARWRMTPELPTIAMAEAGKRAQAEGGTLDQIFAAILEQTPCPEAWPQQGAHALQPETFRKSDALWELESSIKDLARQSEGEYRARYYAGAVGFLRGLHMMRVVDAEERNRWKVKILEAHLQAIAQCEAAGDVVPEEIKRREAFELENLRRMELVTEALQGKEDV